MPVAIASFAALPPEFTDDERLTAALEARGTEAPLIPWDDATTDWGQFDAVVIRSTWDYARRRDEFVAWAESVGETLHNSPAIVRWNSDKRYLGDLAAAGIRVVPTTFVAPGEVFDLTGEVVVKPTVSAGGKDSGRFSEATHDLARELVARIHAGGRTAMIQPYQAAVDAVGETAIVFLDGEPSHVLRKRAVLRPDEVAPVRESDAVGAAEVMYHPDLVVAGEATEEEFAFARGLIAHVAERFDYMPLYARVDMVTAEDGLPVLMELEAIEPNLYLDQAPGAAERAASAIAGRIAG
jgi:hypothetical protein